MIIWFFRSREIKNSIALRMLDSAIIWIVWLSFIQDNIMTCPWVIVLLSIEAVASTCNLVIRLTVETEGRVAQSEEHRPYKPEVTGSSPVPPIKLCWGRSSVG